MWIAPDDENPFGEAALVMELAAGGGLFERLVDEGAYSEEYAAKILRQIAIALYHLHSRGIVHRDIKPENVVFESEQKGDTHVKLIDFGTAVALEERGEKISSGEHKRGQAAANTQAHTSTPTALLTLPSLLPSRRPYRYMELLGAGAVESAAV